MTMPLDPYPVLQVVDTAGEVHEISLDRDHLKEMVNAARTAFAILLETGSAAITIPMKYSNGMTGVFLVRSDEQIRSVNAQLEVLWAETKSTWPDPRIEPES